MSKDIVQIFKDINSIITNSHIVYTSGKHGSFYINKDGLYPYPKRVSEVCKMFAEKYQNEDIDVVIGPALGGIILSTWTAYHLSELENKEILGIFTEKDENNNQIFKRGYDKIVQGKNVLVLEDVTNTGGSVKRVVDAVKQAGGNVVAACVMVNRQPKIVNSEFVGAPFSSLGVIEAEVFEEVDCPLCKKNIPINTDVGHGKKYLANKK
ncbi:MAG: phosphoribosyltransferase family protein [Patescibacteria group bacterium]